MAPPPRIQNTFISAVNSKFSAVEVRRRTRDGRVTKSKNVVFDPELLRKNLGAARADAIIRAKAGQRQIPKTRYIEPEGYLRMGDNFLATTPASLDQVFVGDDPRQVFGRTVLAPSQATALSAVMNLHHSPRLDVPLFQNRGSDMNGESLGRFTYSWRYYLTEDGRAELKNRLFAKKARVLVWTMVVATLLGFKKNDYRFVGGGANYYTGFLGLCYKIGQLREIVGGAYRRFKMARAHFGGAIPALRWYAYRRDSGKARTLLGNSTYDGRSLGNPNRREVEWSAAAALRVTGVSRYTLPKAKVGESYDQPDLGAYFAQLLSERGISNVLDAGLGKVDWSMLVGEVLNLSRSREQWQDLKKFFRDHTPDESTALIASLVKNLDAEATRIVWRQVYETVTLAQKEFAEDQQFEGRFAAGQVWASDDKQILPGEARQCTCRSAPVRYIHDDECDANLGTDAWLVGSVKDGYVTLTTSTLGMNFELRAKEVAAKYPVRRLDIEERLAKIAAKEGQ